MADELSLREAYLAQLAAALPLPEEERAAVLEELAAHLDSATADLVARGIPAGVAMERALHHLGAPRRLAGDLAAVHRTPRHALAAVGVGLRTAVVGGFWSVIVLYTIFLTAVFAVGMLTAIAGSWLGIHLDLRWGSGWNALLAGLIGAVTAYAVGRMLLPATAAAARRRPEELLPFLLPVGGAIAAWIGLAGVELSWTPAAAALMALLPGWFMLGVLRPGLLPRWFPGSAKRIGAVLLLVAGISLVAFLAVGSGSTTTFSGTATEFDFGETYGRLGPLVGGIERPAVELRDTQDQTFGYATKGSGPVTIAIRADVVRPTALTGWIDLHLEVWRTGPREAGPTPPVGDAPIAVAPLRRESGELSGSVTFRPWPETESYYVALIGTGPHGERGQLAWPAWQPWEWSGSVWDYLTAPR